MKTIVRTTRVMEPVEDTSHVYEQQVAVFRIYQVVWYFLGLIESLLGLRVVLKAVGANPTSGFVSFIYSVSDPLIIPFVGIIRSSVSGISVMEWSTIIAMIVYLLLGYAIVQLFQLMKPVSTHEVEETIDE